MDDTDVVYITDEEIEKPIPVKADGPWLMFIDYVDGQKTHANGGVPSEARL